MHVSHRLFGPRAAVRTAAHQRKELERLCRYITRPAIANERLSRNSKGEVVLQRARMSWARLLKRVFDIDIEPCECGGQLKIIAAIEEPAVIARILTHLGLRARAPPRSPACSPQLIHAA